MWFITIIGEVYRFVWKESSHFYFSAAEPISLILQKKNNKTNMTLKVLSVDAAKQLLFLLMLPNSLTK